MIIRRGVLPTAGRSAHRIVPHQLEPTLEGNPWNCPHRPGAGRSPFVIAAGGGGERANPEEEPMHGKAATHRQRVRRTLARVFAVWRTGLPRPVLVLQGGNALNYFGTGLILPFEIIYLHAVRGFSTATAGLVLATVMGTAAVVTLPSGALLDRFSAKRILIAGNVLNALGYGGLALVVLVWIPDPGLADAPSASEGVRGFRAVARDRLLLALIAGNLALVMIGGGFFSYILPPFAEAHTPVGPVGIGVVVFINTFFIVVAQVPATRVVARMRRTHALFATSAIFAVGLLAVPLATLTHSTLAATTVLAGVAIVIAVAECGQFIVLGPLVAEIAPPHLLGRYMSLYQLSFMVGVALGPAVGGVLLATSPDTIWWGGAFALALTGAGLLRLGNRIPDPLLPTKSPPLQAASAAT